MLLPLHLHGIFHFVPVDEEGSFSEHQIASANTSFVCLLPTQVSRWMLLFPPTFILAKRAAALQPVHFKTGRTHWSQTQTGDKKQHWKGMLVLIFHTRLIKNKIMNRHIDFRVLKNSISFFFESALYKWQQWCFRDGPKFFFKKKKKEDFKIWLIWRGNFVKLLFYRIYKHFLSIKNLTGD